MHFTGEITLGNLAIVVTMIGIAVGVGRRVGSMETLLKSHGSILVNHTNRLDTYEGRLLEIVGHVQRIVGRLEATQDRLDRSLGGGRA